MTSDFINTHSNFGISEAHNDNRIVSRFVKKGTKMNTFKRRSIVSHVVYYILLKCYNTTVLIKIKTVLGKTIVKVLIIAFMTLQQQSYIIYIFFGFGMFAYRNAYNSSIIM